MQDISFLSSNLLEEETLLMRFEDLTFKEEFEGVWASASLLHIPYDELHSVLQKLHLSLKKEGILYASFKYGHDSREAPDGRIFYDMNEHSILSYIEQRFVPIEIWKTPDKRSSAPSPDQAWLRILAKKK